MWLLSRIAFIVVAIAYSVIYCVSRLLPQSVRPQLRWLRREVETLATMVELTVRSHQR